MEVKDNFIQVQIDRELSEYRRAISELGSRINFMSCTQIVDYLTQSNKEIDFIEFGKSKIEALLADGKIGTSVNYRAVINSLVDFFQRDSVSINEINAVMLRSYEKYLRSERKLVRQSKNKKEFTIISPPLADGGLHNHMRDLRALFNSARDEFNDEDLGIIKIAHYPFKKYKIISRPETAKRNIDIAQIAAIKNSDWPEGSRPALARDLFMLSFYMCGTNSVDFYQMSPKNLKNGRLEYKRSKTKGKRKDQAFISIKVVDEAQPLIDKYLGVLNRHYSSRVGLSTALSYGMRKIQQQLNIPGVTFYWARHTFATIARNTCRKSKDDVAMALNHIDDGRKTTDIYIEKDWKILDEVQEAVIGVLNEELAT
ncbi:site-specific integrase [Mucilaginibacter limnophilus]|nr:site-specific integrase [Mucilaginibacter limnophilus]